MRCQGEFVFKSIERREGGAFTDDKGRDIKFDPAYVVKVDELLNGKINERKLKFPIDNANLYNKLVKLDTYTKIKMVFDVTFYGLNSQPRVIPIDLA